jgi:hypothetical protein
MTKKTLPGFNATASLTRKGSYTVIEKFNIKRENIVPQINPWMCAMLGAACLASIVDPIPGDEVACILAANLCAESA